MTEDTKGLRTRLGRQSEEALGKLAQDLLDNPLVNRALTAAFDGRERAVQAQEAAMGALNIPSAADIERLTRRLRSVAQRLEGIEDSLDRLDRRLESSSKGAAGDDLAARLEELTAEVRKLSSAPAAKPKPAAKKPAAKKPAAKKPAAKKPAAKKPAAKKPAPSS
jgi:chromosome segregation ATPase